MALETTIPTECPSDAELVELLEERHSGPPAARLEQHVAACRACHERVDALMRERWPAHAIRSVSGELLERGAPIGRYRILSLIGRGGMGTVYRARDEQTGNVVALKVLRRSEHREAPERFLREAQVLSELCHPGIVAYLAHGETEIGEAYLAMEWLQGENLTDRLTRGPLLLPEALVLVRHAAEALASAHARGVVHRDLKPGNLFLRGGEVGCPVLLDFGLARRGAASQAITHTGVIVGTPAYMAPEQARGERHLSSAADVFSLGCVLFECLTGKPPFVGEQVMAVLAQVLFAEAPRLADVHPGAPEAVDALLARMLAKRAEDRFEDAAALVAALDTLGALGELRPAAASRPPNAGGEQQLLSILMVAPPAAPRSETVSLEATTATAVPALVELQRELEGHGARLEVLADGSLVATLLHTGAEVTDQATRAARCAMLLQARWPEATVALGTGRGLLHQHAITGEAFDRTAALLRDHACGSGARQVVIDEVTRGLLEVRFVVERTPSGAYVLTGEELSLDATRPLLGKPTACVGREVELAMLEASLAACIEEAEPRAVLVKAPPGVGKSRLRHELIRRSSARGDDVLVVIGRGDPLSAGTSYGLLGQALRRLSGILDGESLEARRVKLATRIGERLPEASAARVVAFIGELAGVPFPDDGDVKLRAARQDPLVMSDQITTAALDLLRAECAARPVLLVLEDLHWSDALTVKLVGTALSKLAGCPLMVLALARPEVDETFPRVWSSVAQVVTLSPLRRRAGERLAQQVLGARAGPETVALIVEQSEGNALFLEELIRGAAGGRGHEASATVLAMVQARIGRLAAGARRLLRAASVLGETAGRGGIRALFGGSTSDEEVDGWLAPLLDEEILVERSERRFPGEKVYRFRHALVRDAAYALAAEEERVAWHRLAAEHLEARGEPDSLVLAEHFLLGREPLRAAPHYLRAGEESYEANDMAAALSSAKRGLTCGAEGELRGALLSLEVSACVWREEFNEVIALGTEAIALLPEGTRRWCRALRYLCAAAAFSQQTALVAELAPRFARVEPSADARGEYVQGATWFAVTLAVTGMKEASRAFRKRAWQTGTAAGRGDLLTWGYITAMEAFDHILFEEAPWSAMTRLAEARDALRAVSEQRYQLMTCAYHGKALHDLGDLADAEAELRETLAQTERLDEAVPLAYARAYLARILAQTAPIDRLDEPTQLARDVIAAKNVTLKGDAHGTLAMIRRRQGALLDAEREASAAYEAVRPFPGFVWDVLALQMHILLEQGRAEDALAVGEAGVRELDRLGVEGWGEIALRLSMAEALHAVGRTDAARATLADLIPRLKKRADDIPEPAARERYLTNVPANARVVALTLAWLGEEAARALDS
jgi:hypothetical protein